MANRRLHRPPSFTHPLTLPLLDPPSPQGAAMSAVVYPNCEFWSSIRSTSPSSPTEARVGSSGKPHAQRILLRNVACCARLGPAVPVDTARKVEALRADFRSAAQLADLLGVSRSQVTRWLRGAGIDPLNAEKVDLLELVWSSLLRLYEREAAVAWLMGVNPLLGDRRPIDLIRTGRTEELMRAIRAERSDTFA